MKLDINLSLNEEIVTIAVDVMGGDHAPHSVLSAVESLILIYPHVHWLLFGDKENINRILAKDKRTRDACSVVHSDITIEMDEKPSAALRRGFKNSSMGMAIHAVNEGRAQAVVSGGNTGALMAISKLALKMLPGISRPSIAGIWPTISGLPCVVLDLGANLSNDTLSLVQSAALGHAYAKTRFKRHETTIGLLNIGAEDIKGTESLKEAARILSRSTLKDEFKGFVEGADIGMGKVNVVVTDGFTGNIALKTAEGTAIQMSRTIKEEMRRSLLSMLGATLARGAFARVQKRLDTRLLNGGVLLGLNGIVIKSHGNSDALGFSYALRLAHQLSVGHLLENMRAQFESDEIFLDKVT